MKLVNALAQLTLGGRHDFRALLIVTFVFTLSTLTFSQTSRGTVSGTVTDPNGAVIAGAEVMLTSAATKLSRTTKTNRKGFIDSKPSTGSLFPES